MYSAWLNEVYILLFYSNNKPLTLLTDHLVATLRSSQHTGVLVNVCGSPPFCDNVLSSSLECLQKTELICSCLASVSPIKFGIKFQTMRFPLYPKKKDRLHSSLFSIGKLIEFRVPLVYLINCAGTRNFNAVLFTFFRCKSVEFWSRIKIHRLG